MATDTSTEQCQLAFGLSLYMQCITEIITWYRRRSIDLKAIQIDTTRCLDNILLHSISSLAEEFHLWVEFFFPTYASVFSSSKSVVGMWS
jgi:hypothetical protein